MKITYKVSEHFDAIGRENSDEFAKDILRLEESDIEDVTIDFDGIEYLSSMGIGTLYSLAQGLKQRKGDLHLVNLSDTLKKVFEVSGLTTYLGAETEDEEKDDNTEDV